jgi:hypothetical protein
MTVSGTTRSGILNHPYWSLSRLNGVSNQTYHSVHFEAPIKIYIVFRIASKAAFVIPITKGCFFHYFLCFKRLHTTCVLEPLTASVDNVCRFDPLLLVV